MVRSLPGFEHAESAPEKNTHTATIAAKRKIGLFFIYNFSVKI